MPVNRTPEIADLELYDPGARLASVPCLLAENEHGWYCVPTESAARPAARRVLAGEEWEPETAALLCRAAEDGDVVTAGAYFGDMLPRVAAAAAPDSVLWAFEPSPVNFSCACWTLRLNEISNTRLARAALGEANRAAEVVVRDVSGSLGGLAYVADARRPQQRPPSIGARARQIARRARRALAEGRQVATMQAPCPVVALDEFLDHNRPLRLIHLDVEGYEGEALAGAQRLLERWRPVLVLEWPPTSAAIWEHVQALGYTERGRAHENTVYAVS